jgi:multicomponent Na+:H+ antiporter subunit A
LAIVSPLLLAVIIPIFSKSIRQIHTGWFVLPLPVVLFSYFLSFISTTSHQGTVYKSFEWIPSLGINFAAKIDGLGLLFALLISGIREG